MAWIESHQALERHPKVLQLSQAMGWDLDQTIGKLHRLWWWCLDFAPDGQLDKYSPQALFSTVQSTVPSTVHEAEHWLRMMCELNWFDSEPNLRVHDWWDYAGRFLYVKYKRTPKKWKAIKRLYVRCKQPNRSVVSTVKTTLNQPNQPNLTNLTNRSLSARAMKLGELEALSLTEALQSWAQQEFGVRIPEDVLSEFKAYWREQRKLRTDWTATLKSRVRQLVSRGILKASPSNSVCHATHGGQRCCRARVVEGSEFCAAHKYIARNVGN